MTYDEAIKRICDRNYDNDVAKVLKSVVTEGMRKKICNGVRLSCSEIDILLHWEIFPYEQVKLITTDDYVAYEYACEVEKNKYYMLAFGYIYYETLGPIFEMFSDPVRCSFKEVVIKKWVCDEED